MSLSLSALHGSLNDIRFPRILSTLAGDGFTGVIQVTTPAGGADPDGLQATTTREVHLSVGHIAWAISTDRQESLRAFLERDRTITDSQWNAAEERAREGSLREALTGLGLVKARELAEIEAARAEAIVLELFSMQEGEYRVRERQLSPGTPDLEIPVRPLLLKGTPERVDRDFALQELGSLDAIFSLRKEAIEDAPLPGEYASIVNHLDGKRSIARLCSETGLPDNFVLSLLAGLSLAGALEHGPGEPARRTETLLAQPEAEEETLEPLEAAAGDRDGADDEQVPIVDAIEVIEEETLEPLEAAAGDTDWTQDDRVDPEESEDLFDDVEEPIEEIPASVYGEGGLDTSTRRWFLIGGAAAVGFVALLLILAAQNRGDAGELSTLASPPATTLQAEDVHEAPATIQDEYPDTADTPLPEPEPLTEDSRAHSPGAVAGTTESPILSPKGHEVEAGGASGRAGRSALSRSGDFTIKILTACQEGTVERAIAKAGNPREMFTRPADIGGRSCRRLYWGSYATREQAQQALRRDVPAFFRNDRNPPAIVPMP